MKVALDVHYDEARSTGTGAAVVFDQWTEAVPLAEYTARVNPIGSYIPGEFFRRELPVLLAVLKAVIEPVDLVVVDSYVHLKQKPGLGQYLFESLGSKVPVIGVAKTRFHDAPAIEVIRGGSKSPLYVTAVGIDGTAAADSIRSMSGPFRIPELLKRVDRICREGGSR